MEVVSSPSPFSRVQELGMICSICSKVILDNFQHKNDNLLIVLQTLFKLSKIPLPNNFNWSLCEEESCQQILNGFLHDFQQFCTLKDGLRHKLLNIFINVVKYSEIQEVEGCIRDLLERLCTLDSSQVDLLIRHPYQVQEHCCDDGVDTNMDHDSDTDIDQVQHSQCQAKHFGGGGEQDESIEGDGETGIEFCSAVDARGQGQGQTFEEKEEEVQPGQKRKVLKIIDSTSGKMKIGRRKRVEYVPVVPPSVEDCNNEINASVNSCDKCGKTFLNPYSLRTHKRTHLREGLNNDGSFHCTHCTAIVSSLADLKEHRSKEHERARDFCPICRKQMSKGSLQQHLHSHYLKQALIPLSSSDQVILCTLCAKSFTSPLLLASHMDVHKGDYSCLLPNCRKSFYSSSARIKHVETVHGENSLSQDCCYCFQVFGTEHDQEFQVHLKKHEEEIMTKTFLCETCGSYFRNKKSLQTHSRLNHHRRGISESEYKCEVCGKSFMSPQRLKVHQLTHKQSISPTASTRFTCPEIQCGKVFNQKVSLKSHLMVHHASEMRYKCPHCDHPGFTYSQGLRTHVFKIHNEVYSDRRINHVCKVCCKNFLTEGELLIHIGNHDKLKCRLCSKQFKSMNHLKEHTLRHASIRPFKCPHCQSKGYVRQEQLNEHMRKVHQQNLSLHTQNPGSPQQLAERITYVIQIP